MITAATETALVQVRQLLSDGRGKEAAAVAQTQLAERPDDGRFVQLLGLAQYVEGRRCAALAAFETALLLSPLSPEALLALADCYVTAERPRDAEVSLNLLAERSDLSAELLPRVAALLGRIGDLRGALNLCRRAAERDPDCDEALFGAAFYMRRLNFPLEMVAALLRRAVRLDPSCCLYRRTLAGVLTSMNEVAEAYELYRSLTPQQVCCTGCLRMMIDVFDRTGDADRCEACRARLAELDARTKE